MSIAVLAIHLDAHKIPKLAMGGLAAAFAFGIVTFSLPAGWLVQRFGAKRTFFVALVGYAIYELYLGMTEEYSRGGSRGERARGAITGGGEGMETETIDESGAAVPRTVGRGVVS